MEASPSTRISSHLTALFLRRWKPISFSDHIPKSFSRKYPHVLRCQACCVPSGRPYSPKFIRVPLHKTIGFCNNTGGIFSLNWTIASVPDGSWILYRIENALQSHLVSIIISSWQRWVSYLSVIWDGIPPECRVGETNKPLALVESKRSTPSLF